MVDIAQIGFSVDTRDLSKANVSLDRLTQSARGVQSQVNATNSSMAQAAQVAPRMSSSVSRLGSSFGRLGPGVQNASFQLQDIIVQMQMGVPVSRTLGQQLPQLLGGFGPLGAVLGVVAGGMASLIPLMFSTSDAMDDAKNSADSYKTALESLALVERDYRDFLAQREGVFIGGRIQRAREELAVAKEARDTISAAYRAGEASADDLAEAQQRVSDLFLDLRFAENLKREMDRAKEIAESGFGSLVTGEANAANQLFFQQTNAYVDAVRDAAKRADAEMKKQRDLMARSGTGSLVTGGPSAASQEVFDRANAASDATRRAAEENKKYERTLNDILNAQDPVREATQRYNEQLEILNNAVQNGDITWQEYGKTLGGIQDELKRTQDRVSGVDRFMQTAESSIDSYFDSFVSGTMSASDALKGFIIELGKAAQQQLIFQATGGASSGIGGLLTQGLGALFGGFGAPAAATSATGGYIIAAPGGSFADGGSFTVGGQFPAVSAGRDNRLVSFAARDGEKVSISTPGSMAGGDSGVTNVYNIDARGAESGVEERIMAALKSLAGPGVTERRALGAVVNERQRNPRLFGAGAR